MNAVLADVSVSLDGFAAGPGVSVRDPMGLGGERLHRWLSPSPSDAVDAEVVRRMADSVGAVVLGRTTYDVGRAHWDGTPFPAPTFVVTHRTQDDIATGTGVFHFAGGIREAVDRAREAAGDRDVAVMGAAVTQQVIAAGLLDELHLHVVPVILGDGVRLLEGLGDDRIELEPLQVLSSDRVTHLRYRVRS